MKEEPVTTRSHLESVPASPPGATVVITHRVRNDRHADYEKWLQEISPLCQASPGHLDVQIIRPIAGLTETYTVIIRFDTDEHLRGWMESPQRRGLIEKARSLLALDDAYTIHSGLDFWFTPASATSKVPKRWKQFLLTWSAIYPLVLIMPPMIVPMLRPLGIENRFAATLFVTAIMVFLMVYVIMPHYTKLVRKWLFK